MNFQGWPGWASLWTNVALKDLHVFMNESNVVVSTLLRFKLWLAHLTWKSVQVDGLMNNHFVSDKYCLVDKFLRTWIAAFKYLLTLLWTFLMWTARSVAFLHLTLHSEHEAGFNFSWTDLWWMSTDRFVVNTFEQVWQRWPGLCRCFNIRWALKVFRFFKLFWQISQVTLFSGEIWDFFCCDERPSLFLSSIFISLFRCQTIKKTGNYSSI
jgi:hypothetical protein